MVSAYGVLVLSGYLVIWAAGFVVFSSKVRSRVAELVTQGSEKYSAGIEREKRRTPQVTTQQQIREITGSGRGRAQEDKKIRR